MFCFVLLQEKLETRCCHYIRFFGFYSVLFLQFHEIWHIFHSLVHHKTLNSTIFSMMFCYSIENRNKLYYNTLTTASHWRKKYQFIIFFIYRFLFKLVCYVGILRARIFCVNIFPQLYKSQIWLTRGMANTFHALYFIQLNFNVKCMSHPLCREEKRT